MKIVNCLAFDLGASSGRAILGTIDEQNQLQIKEVHRFKNYPFEENGHWYWDFEKLLTEIKTGIKKACEVTGKIDSMSIDTWGVDYVFFRDGKPIRNPFNYRDPRTESVLEKFHQNQMSQEELYARNGTQILALNTIYQLLAHKQDYPQDFENSTCLLMPDALLYMLTGEISCEYTIASTTGLLDPYTRNWNQELLKKLDIPQSVFPEIVMPGTRIKSLKKEICEELQIPCIPAVKVGSHDTASAVAAVPVSKKSGNWAYLSSGTWALLGMELDTPDTSDTAFQCKYTNEGGVEGKIRFLINIIGTWLLQETKRVWDEQGDPVTFAQMEEMAATLGKSPFRIDPNAKEFVAPGDMPEKIRTYCREHGQGEIPSKASLVRCIYDSLAECFSENIKHLAAMREISLDALYILGGATRDRLLMQLTADAIGFPVGAGPIEATTLGNLMVQFIACGAIKDLAEARKIIQDSFPIQWYLPSDKE